MNRSFLFRRSHTAIACLMLTLAAAAPSLADNVDPARLSRGTVSLADLDLSRPADIAIARERVHQAARKRCARVADPLNLGHQADYVACVESSMAQAQPGIEKLAAAASANAQRFAQIQR